MMQDPAHVHEQGLDLGICGALGGTRTPNLLIRRLCHAPPLPAYSPADLPKRYSLMRSRRQH
jgi:hypothetical protein